MWVTRNLAVVIALALVTVATHTASAHHGWSGYDSNQVLNLTGVIQASGYEHPHSYVKLVASDKVWLAVLAPPSRMERRGVSREMLAVGTTLAVFPIAGVVPVAKEAGARVVIVNAEPTAMDDVADAVLRGSISAILPRLVQA